jgi:hypothetical protein
MLTFKHLRYLAEASSPEKLCKGLPTEVLRRVYAEAFGDEIDNMGNSGIENSETLNRDELIEDLIYALEYEVDEGVEGEIRAAKDFN